MAGLHILGADLDGTFLLLFPSIDCTIHILMSDFHFSVMDPPLPHSFCCLLNQVEPAVNYQIKLRDGVTLMWIMLLEKLVLLWSYC